MILKSSLLSTVLFGLALSATGFGSSSVDEFLDKVEHGYADSAGVKIHYVSLGQGPLVVMIHGFPDYWYSWRDQMEALAKDFRVVAIDQRGYNKSDKPKGVDQYAMPLLVGDVAAVIRHLGQERATVVGHDWGGVVAWQFAFHVPQMLERLIILNLPHPNGLGRELRTNPKQYENSAYARAFQEGKPSDPKIFFGRPMTPETLAGWVRDPAAKKLYVEAFGRSDFDAMLNYYKKNYPSSQPGESPPSALAPNINVPVLMFHGLDDQALLSDGLNNNWDWIDQDLTLVTVPGAGHFVQQDASELVTKTMAWWLSR